MKIKDKCPSCGANLDGGSILATFMKQKKEGARVWQNKTRNDIIKYMKEYYSPPYRWSKLISIEDYSGVIVICCQECFENNIQNNSRRNG